MTNNHFIWCSSIIAVLFVLFIIFYRYITPVKASHAILLTTFNNSPEKKKLYEETIQWWLDHGNTEIFVVDSNNVGFPDLDSYKLFQYKFDQKDRFPVTKETLSVYEVHAILIALQAFQDKLYKYKYVVKVTGKYKIPRLPSRLQKLNHLQKDLILQYRSENKNSYNTEYIGFLMRKAKEILRCVESKKGCFERAIYDCQQEKKWTFLHFPPLSIPKPYRVQRTNGSTLSFV